ncbi:YveK family protein, partial [Paraconexibacter sp.]|uniref:YveK family protein n=1 Tax=Paraconexibacter sp. TaxID=2949640 RepID=UPI00356786A3
MNQAAQGDPHTTTLRDYLRILRQHRIGIVLIVVGIVVTTVALTAQVSKSYRAESSIQLRDVTQDVGLIGRVDVLPTNPAVSASQAADLVRSVQVSTQVRDELNSPLSIRELRSKVTGNVELRTNLVIVTAVDDGARDAKILADEFARQTAKYLNAQQRARLIGAQRSLERELKRVLTRVRDKDSPTRDTDALTASAYRQEIAQLASLQRFSKAAVLVESADLPAAPFSPRPVRNAVIALILGLTLGVGYAFLRNSLDRRLRSADDVRREFPYALLGMLSGDALGATAVPTPGGRVMPATDIEAARIIRTNLGYLDVDDPAKLIAVTSALPAEGKSTVASAVATASALSGQLTLLIECDLRRPSLAGRLGIERSPGLSDYLGGNATPAEVLQTVR